MNASDTLTFKFLDSTYGDNAGSFDLSSPAASTSIPEPFTVIGTIVGGMAAVGMRKKLRADK